MTIAAGFHFDDGVLLCADREYTQPDGTTVNASKLFPYVLVNKKGERLGLDFAISGHVPYAMMVRDRVIDAVLKRPWNFIEIRNTLAKVLLRFHNEHIFCHPDYLTGNYTIQLLVSARHDGDTRLLSTCQTAVNEVKEFDCIGIGSGFTKMLVNALHRPWPYMDIKKTVLLATFALRQTKKYIGWCGFDTQFCASFKGPLVKSTTHDTKISVDDSYSDAFFKMLGESFYALAEPEVNSDFLEAQINKLKEDIAKLRGLAMKESEDRKALIDKLRTQNNT